MSNIAYKRDYFHFSIENTIEKNEVSNLKQTLDQWSFSSDDTFAEITTTI